MLAPHEIGSCRNLVRVHRESAKGGRSNLFLNSTTNKTVFT